MTTPSLPTSATHYTIAKLKEPERYLAWSQYMTVALAGEGLYDYVDGSIPCPVDLHSEFLTTDERTQGRTWRQWDCKAMMRILGALDESLYAQYCQYKTSMDL